MDAKKESEQEEGSNLYTRHGDEMPFVGTIYSNDHVSRSCTTNDSKLFQHLNQLEDWAYLGSGLTNPREIGLETKYPEDKKSEFSQAVRVSETEQGISVFSREDGSDKFKREEFLRKIAKNRRMFEALVTGEGYMKGKNRIGIDVESKTLKSRMSDNLRSVGQKIPSEVSENHSAIEKLRIIGTKKAENKYGEAPSVRPKTHFGPREVDSNYGEVPSVRPKTRSGPRVSISGNTTIEIENTDNTVEHKKNIDFLGARPKTSSLIKTNKTVFKETPFNPVFSKISERDLNVSTSGESLGEVRNIIQHAKSVRPKTYSGLMTFSPQKEICSVEAGEIGINEEKQIDLKNTFLDTIKVTKISRSSESESDDTSEQEELSIEESRLIALNNRIRLLRKRREEEKRKWHWRKILGISYVISLLIGGVLTIVARSVDLSRATSEYGIVLFISYVILGFYLLVFEWEMSYNFFKSWCPRK